MLIVEYNTLRYNVNRNKKNFLPMDEGRKEDAGIQQRCATGHKTGKNKAV